MSIHLGDAFYHLESSLQPVDVADPQCRQFTESESGVGQDPDREAVLTGGVREDGHLFVGEEPLLFRRYSREPNTGCRVAGDPVVFDRQRQQ